MTGHGAPAVARRALPERKTAFRVCAAYVLQDRLQKEDETMTQDQSQAQSSQFSGSAPAPSMPNVLLVHGAWADGTSWSGLIPLLRARGHSVVAIQLSLNSLADDVAHVQQVLADRLQGPTVLVGHSYGGAVISGAATGQANAIALVYASAFAPDAGEALGPLSGKYPAAPLNEHLHPDSRGKLWIDSAKYHEVFCQDVDATQASVMEATQGPLAGAIFGEPAGPVAWHTLPSWYLVSTVDRAIPPDLERFMAKRIGATTIEVDSSHASLVSHPHEVAELIFAAAQTGVRS
jgi:pimeloyl-ACP methyl ester carboxylesterase